MKSETHISLHFPHYIRTCYSADATNMLFTWFHFHLPPNIQIYPSVTSFPHFIPTNMFFDSMIVFFSLIFCLCLCFAFYSIFLILFCIIIRLVLKLLTPSMKYFYLWSNQSNSWLSLIWNNATMPSYFELWDFSPHLLCDCLLLSQKIHKGQYKALSRVSSKYSRMVSASSVCVGQIDIPQPPCSLWF